MREYDIENDDSYEIPQVELFNGVNEEYLKHSEIGPDDHHSEQGRKEEDDAYCLVVGHADGNDDHGYDEDIDDYAGSFELFSDDICYIEVEGVVLIVNRHKAHHHPNAEYYQGHYLQYQYRSRR